MRLYHYTTARAFAKILLNREIWLTDYRFLNDREEFRFSEKIAENTLSEVDFTTKRDRLVQARTDELCVNQYDQFVKHFRDRFVPLNFAMSLGFAPYVFSLSSECDSLSQWRAYGNGELCIEFASEKLTAVTGVSLLPVKYVRETDIDGGLRDAIDKYFENKVEQAIATGRFEGETVLEGARDLNRYIRETFRPISIKHDGFIEENEWRMVKEYRSDSKHDTFFDLGRFPTPRAKVRFHREIPVSQVVTGVTFGPGSDKDIACACVAALNQALGTHYQAKFSRIPYRT